MTSTKRPGAQIVAGGAGRSEERLYWYAPRDGTNKVLQQIGTVLLGVTLPAFWGFEVAGREHLREPGGVLLVCNHLADVDMPFLASAVVPRALQYVSATKNFTSPFVGYLVSGLGAFPVHTDRPDPSGLRYAREQLEAGRTVLIFPEGRPTFGPDLAPFAFGAGRLALTPGTRVVPAAIWGTHRVIRGRYFPVGRGRVRAAFGPPVPVPQTGSRRARAVEVTDACRDAVASLLERLVAMDPEP